MTGHVNYERDAATFAEWGVDWVKMDWCNTEVAAAPFVVLLRCGLALPLAAAYVICGCVEGDDA